MRTVLLRGHGESAQSRLPMGHLLASACAFTSVPAILSINLYGYRLSGLELYRFNLLLTLAFVASLIFLVYCLRRFPEPTNHPRAHRVILAISHLVAVGFLVVYLHLTTAIWQPSASFAVVHAVSLGALALSAWRTCRPAVLIGLVIGITLVQSLALIAHVPFEENGGDMLLLIAHGVDRLFAGRFPYEDLSVRVGQDVTYSGRPLTYLPLLWLSYMPLRAAELDLRYLSVVSMLAVAILVAANGFDDRGDVSRPLLPLLLVLWCLSPLLLWKMASVQTPVYWAALGLFGTAFLRAWRPAAVGGLAAVLLGTRELAVLVVPFVAVYYWRHSRAESLPFAAALGLGVMLIVCPFLLIDPGAFLSALQYNALYVAEEAFARRVQLTHVGFGGWLMAAGWDGYVRSVQLLMVSGCCAAAMRATTRPGIMYWSASAYFLFLLVNTVIFEYYYLEAFLVLLLAAGYRAEHAPRRPALREGPDGRDEPRRVTASADLAAAS